MSRPLRIEYENAFYHVIARGHRKNKIFFCNGDREKFLKKLTETVEKYSVNIHAYVLMDNHYHFLIETPFANLSSAIHNLNSSYCNWLRVKYQIIGSIFQGRYKSILVEKDQYLKVLSAYIHLNPVKAGYVKSPEEYQYSSYSYYCKKKTSPNFLIKSELMGMFNSIQEYQQYVKNYNQPGIDINSEEIYGKNSILGSRIFIRQAFEKMRKTNGKKSPKRTEQTEVKRFSQLNEDDIFEIIITEMKIPEEELFRKKRNNEYRKLLIYALKKHTGCSLKKIGKITDMEYHAVSAMARRFEKDLPINQHCQYLTDRLNRLVMRRKFLK